MRNQFFGIPSSFSNTAAISATKKICERTYQWEGLQKFLVQNYKLSEIFCVPYLGFMPERGASLPRGELSL
jgi:hypothetical protein